MLGPPSFNQWQPSFDAASAKHHIARCCCCSGLASSRIKCYMVANAGVLTHPMISLGRIHHGHVQYCVQSNLSCTYTADSNSTGSGLLLNLQAEGHIVYDNATMVCSRACTGKPYLADSTYKDNTMLDVQRTWLQCQHSSATTCAHMNNLAMWCHCMLHFTLPQHSSAIVTWSSCLYCQVWTLLALL